MADSTAAAEKLVDTLEKPLYYMQKYLGGISGKPTVKPDTSWHDSMVRKANESFLPSPKSRGTTLKSSRSATTRTKKVNKSSPKQGRGK